jgi:extracellular elastinolytic metalloproteinase
MGMGSRSQTTTRAGITARLAAFVTVLATIAVFALATPASGQGGDRSRAVFPPAGAPASNLGRPNYDSRENAPAIRVSQPVASARASLARSLGSQGVIDVSPVTGTPRVVARLDGFLTGPSAAAPTRIALRYVRSHLMAFGLSNADLANLTLVKDYVDILGTHHLVWQQRYRGVPVFDNDLRASVTKEGRLVNVMGAPIHAIAPRTVTPSVDAASAVSAARRDVGARITSAGAVVRNPEGARRVTSFSSGDTAAMVLFGRSGGTVLAWKVLARVSSTEEYMSVVDAATGRVLWRTNMVKSDSTGTGYAWDYYPGNNVPNNGGVPQHDVQFPVASDSALSGNNAHVFLDVNDDDTPDPGDEIASSTSLTWHFPVVVNTTTPSQNCSPAFPCTWDAMIAYSWQANKAQNATQVYYYLNNFHDHLLASPIGFTEAAGNFQVVNSTGLGLGGDPVMANTDDGANTNKAYPGFPDQYHRNNANMWTPPDGQSPTMQMYLFVPVAGRETSNGGDDAGIVYHEYTHGLSNRLVTFADGYGALDSAQSGAMGEGWSDWYATDLLVNDGFILDGSGADVRVGDYVTHGQGIRTEPLDCQVGISDSACPGSGSAGSGGYTYGDFGKIIGFPEVHADGEIWGQTLWDLRRALGSPKAEMLVTRGMELSPPEPSFLDMRNAIIEADNVAYSGADANALWAIFARRGMGYFASAIDGNDVHPVEDFTMPPTCTTDCATVEGTVTDSLVGSPVQGALVGFAGHMSGLASDLAATTDSSGHYSIPSVPFHAYTLVLQANGYEPFSTAETIGEAIQTIDLAAIRDWAAYAGGARITKFTRPNYAAYGCGPYGALDGSLSSGWGSDSVGNKSSGVAGPRSITVRLPKKVNVTQFAVASNGTCGDGPDAAVKGFTIETKSGGAKWVTAIVNTKRFRLGRLVVFKPKVGKKKVTMIRFTMTSNRGNPYFMDVLEMSVRGRAA